MDTLHVYFYEASQVRAIEDPSMGLFHFVRFSFLFMLQAQFRRACMHVILL